MFRKLLLVVWVAMVVVAVSCKGPAGDVGPAGPKGDTGAAGPAGPAGEDGEGAGAGAFIISTGEADTEEDGSYTTGISDLTPEEDTLLSASAVLAYVKVGGAYWALPGVVPFANSAVSNFTFVHGIQQSTFFVQLIQTGWSEDQDAAPARTFEDIRIVIIPGTVISRMDAETLKDYNKTIESLGLSSKQIKIGKELKIKIPKRK